jgi:hypothetical protein
MTTGGVVVVVGGGVVVVVGGELVGVVAVDSEGAPGSVEVGGDVVGGVVVELLGVEMAGTGAGTALVEALAPGCSLATTTPMAMAAPVTARAVERVSRRRRTAARRLASGVLACGALLIGWRPRIGIVPEKG